MGDSRHRIFLLELLVDKIEFQNPILEQDDQACVRFQFLNNPVLDVCEEDFCPKPGPRSKNVVDFKSGKSVLFSVGSPRAASFELPFDVFVTAVRKKRRGGGEGAVLGTAVVRMGSSFTQLVNQGGGEGSKSLKGDYTLKDSGGRDVGKVTVFLRLSCFGDSIVTQFHLGGSQNRSFLFKGEELAGTSQVGLTTSQTQADQHTYGQGSQPRDIPDVGDMVTCAGSLVPSAGGLVQSAAGQFPNAGGQLASAGGQFPGYPGFPGGFVPSGPQQYGVGQPGMYGPESGGMMSMPGGFGGVNGEVGDGGGWGHPCFCPTRDPAAEEEAAAQELLEDKRYTDICFELNGHAMNVKILRRPKKSKLAQAPVCERVRPDEQGPDGAPLQLEGGPFCRKGSACPLGYARPPSPNKDT